MKTQYSTSTRVLSLLLCLAMILGMAPMMELFPAVVATTNTAATSCGEHGSHEGWTALGGDGTTTVVDPATLAGYGKVKLNGDISIATVVAVTTNLHICLNGHTIKAAQGGFTVSGASLIICDCSTGTAQGKIEGSKTSSQPGINIGANGVVDLFGGTITNFANAGGAAVRIDQATSVFNMHGGTISGNKANNYGGGVYFNAAGIMNMSGGSITGNSAGTYGGGIEIYRGKLNMSGGNITGNTCQNGADLYMGRHSSTAAELTISGVAKVGTVFVNTTTNALSKFTLKNLSLGSSIGPVNVELVTNSTNKIEASLDATVAAPTGDAASGYTYTYNAPKNYVAQIGTTGYESLEAAFAAGNGKTVQLLENVELEAPIAVSGKVALDLNGKIISAKAGAFTVNGSNELTIDDTSANKLGEIKAAAGAEKAPGIFVGVTTGSGGTLNLNNGKISGFTNAGGGGVRVDGANAVFNMTGGIISGNTASHYGGGVFVQRGTFNMSGGSVTGNTCSTGNGVYVGGHNTAAAFHITGSSVVENIYMNTTKAAPTVDIGKLTAGASVTSTSELTVLEGDKTVQVNGLVYTYKAFDTKDWNLFEDTFEDYEAGEDTFFSAVSTGAGKPYYTISGSYHGSATNATYATYGIEEDEDNQYLKITSKGVKGRVVTKNGINGAYTLKMDFCLGSTDDTKPTMAITMAHSSAMAGALLLYVGTGTTGVRINANDNCGIAATSLKNADNSNLCLTADTWYTLEYTLSEGQVSFAVWPVGNETAKSTATVSSDYIDDDLLGIANTVRIDLVGDTNSSNTEKRTDILCLDNINMSKTVKVEMPESIVVEAGDILTTLPLVDGDKMQPAPNYSFELEDEELGYVNQGGQLVVGFKDAKDRSASEGTTKLTVTLLDLRGNKTDVSFETDLKVLLSTGVDIGEDVHVPEAKLEETYPLNLQIKDTVVTLTGYTVSWRSTNEAVVTVGKDGVLTFVGAGTARVTAMVVDAEGNDTEHFATINVQVGGIKPLKVLFIGNSFSADTLEYVSTLADIAGADVETAYLYRGSAKLSHHAYNLAYNVPDYIYYRLASTSKWLVSQEGKYTISEVVESQLWDVIVLHQSSTNASLQNTYNADLEYLVDYLEDVQPNAKLYWNMTWALEEGLDSGAAAATFAEYYGANQKAMYNAIIQAVDAMIVGEDAPFSSSNPNNQGYGLGWGFDGCLFSGAAIQNLRQTITTHDRDLTRDGYHLSYDIGRLAVGMNALKTLYDQLELAGMGATLDMEEVFTAEAIAAIIKDSELTYKYSDADLPKIIAAVEAASAITDVPEKLTVETPVKPEVAEDEVTASIQTEVPMKLYFPDVKALANGVVLSVVYENAVHSPQTYTEASNDLYNAMESGAGRIKLYESINGGTSWNTAQPILVIDELQLEKWGIADIYDRYARVDTDPDTEDHYIAMADPRDPNLATVSVDFDHDDNVEQVVIVTFWIRYYDEIGDQTTGSNLWMLTGVRNDNGTYTWAEPKEVSGAQMKRGDIAVFSNGDILVPGYGPGNYAISMTWNAAQKTWIENNVYIIPNLAADESTHLGEISLVAPDPEGNIVFAFCRENGTVLKSTNRGASWELIGNEEGLIAQPGFTILDENTVFVTWADTVSPRSIYGKVFYVHGDWEDTQKDLIYASANTAAHDMGDPSGTVLADGTVLVVYYDTEYRGVCFSTVDLSNEKWDTPEYTVSFDNGVTSQTVGYGDKATKPADPTKADAVFEGWYLGNTLYDFDAPVFGNLNLTAGWTEVDPDVAQVGDQLFKTLAEAIAAANGNTIQLLRNITLESRIVIEPGQTVVIDLNGKVITCLQDGFELNETNNAQLGAVLTIKDTAGSGKLQGSNASGKPGVVVENYGVFTLESGTITGFTNGVGAGVRVDAPNAKFVMTGGAITGNTATSYAGGVFVKRGSITISGGSITGNMKGANADDLRIGGHGTASATLIVSGDVQIGTIHVDTAAAAKPAVTLKEFTLATAIGPVNVQLTASSTAVTVTRDETVGETQNGSTWTYTIYVSKDYIAQVGDVQYESLSDAIAAANGETVKLLKDITLSGRILIPKGTTVTLDLNGKTITASGNAFEIGGNGYGASDVTTLIIKDSATGGKLQGDGTTDGYGIHLKTQGKLKLESGIITGFVSSGIRVDEATAGFTMTGGSVIGNGTGNPARGGGVHINRGSFTMTGGVISGNTAKAGADVYVGGHSTTAGTIAVSGTAVVAAAMEIGTNGSVTLGQLAAGASILSKTQIAFTDEHTKETNVSGNWQYTYQVDVAPDVAEVDGVPYKTLKSAVEVANGKTVKLLTDVTLSGGIIIPKGTTVTLDLNGKTIHATGNVFEIGGNGYTEADVTTLTIRDSATGGKLQGDGVTESPAIYIKTHGTFNLEDGTITGFIYAGGAGVRVDADGAKFVMSGGCITNNEAKSSGGGVIVNRGSFTMTGGSITGNKKGTAADDLRVGGHSTIAASIAVSGNVQIGKTVIVTSGKMPTVSITQLGQNAAIGPVNTLLVAGSTTVQVTLDATVKADGTEGAWTYTYQNPDAPKDYVAQIGTVKYESLQEALTAGHGKTVQLLKDMELRDMFTISAGNITLDLNGKTLTARKAAFKIIGTADAIAALTVKDTVGGGKIQGSETEGYRGITIAEYASFTLESGTITGFADSSGAGVRVDGYSDALFTMTGGIITGNNGTSSGYGGGVFVYRGTFRMTGGSVVGNYHKTTDKPNDVRIGGHAKVEAIFIASGNIQLGTVNVAQGSDTVKIPVISLTELKPGASIGPVNVGLSASSTTMAVTIDNSVNVIINGSTWTYTYQDPSTPPKYAAQVGNKKFENLSAAIAAAKGDKILLLDNVSVGSGLVVTDKLTIDLNGKTITGTAAPYFTIKGGTLTISDSAEGGKLDGSCLKGSTAGGLVSLEANATFNLSGGSISGHTTSGGGAGVRVDGDNAVFNMTGGSIRDNSTTNYGGGVFVPKGTFNMTGGIITGNTAVGGGVCVSSNQAMTVLGTFNMSGGTVSGNTCNYSGEVHIRKYYAGNINLSGNAVIGGVGIQSGAVISNLTQGASILSTNRLTVMDDTAKVKYVEGGYLYEYESAQYDNWILFEENFESFATGKDTFFDAATNSNHEAYRYWSGLSSYHGSEASGKYSLYGISESGGNKYLDMTSVEGMRNWMLTKNGISGAYTMKTDIRFASGATTKPVISINLFQATSLEGTILAYISPGNDGARIANTNDKNGNVTVMNSDGFKLIMDYDVWYTVEYGFKEGEIFLNIWPTAEPTKKASAVANTTTINTATMQEAAVIRVASTGKAGRTDYVHLDNFSISKKIDLTIPEFVVVEPGEELKTMPSGAAANQVPAPSYKFELDNPELGYINRKGTLTGGYKSMEDTSVTTGETGMKLTLLDIRGNKTDISFETDLIVGSSNGVSIGNDIQVKESAIGETKQLKATVSGAVAAAVPGYRLQWTSSNPSAVKVDGNGKLTYVGTGSAKITVTVLNAAGEQTRYYSIINVQVGERIIKVLALGSTLGRDSVAYLSQLAYAAGLRVEVGHLMQNADSIHDNAYNLSYNVPYYEWYVSNAFNGELLYVSDNVTIAEKVESQEWDVILITQEMNAQGLLSTYNSDLEYLIDYLEVEQPKAKIYWNMLWTMQSGLTNMEDGFGYGFKNYYDSNSNIMYNAFVDCLGEYIVGDKALFNSSNPNNLGATNTMSGIGWGFDGYIANATTILKLREMLNHDKGITRDSVHLSLDVGRLAASMTVLKTIHDDLQLSGSGVNLNLYSELTTNEVGKIVNTTKKDYRGGKNSTDPNGLLAVDTSKYVYSASDLHKIMDAVNLALDVKGLPEKQKVPAQVRVESITSDDETQNVISSIQASAPLKLYFTDIKALNSGKVLVGTVYEYAAHAPTAFSNGSTPYDVIEEGGGRLRLYESTDGGYTWNYDDPILMIDEFQLQEWGICDSYNRYAAIGIGSGSNYTAFADPRDPNVGTAYIDFDGDGDQEEVLLMTFWVKFYNGAGKSHINNQLWMLTGLRNADGNYTWAAPKMINGAQMKRGDIAWFADGEIVVPGYGPNFYAVRMSWDKVNKTWNEIGVYDIPNLAPEELASFNEISLVAPNPKGNVLFAYCRENGIVMKSNNRGKTWELVGNEDGAIAQPGFAVLDEERVFVTWAQTSSPRTIYGKVYYVNGDWSDTKGDVIYASPVTAAHDMGDPSCAVDADGNVIVIAYDVAFRSIVLTKVDPNEDRWLPLELFYGEDLVLYESGAKVELSDKNAISGSVNVFGAYTTQATVEFTSKNGVVNLATMAGTVTISAGQLQLNTPTNIEVKSVGAQNYVKVWQGSERPKSWTIYIHKGATSNKPVITGADATLKSVTVTAKLFAEMQETASILLGVPQMYLDYTVQPATADVKFTSNDTSVVKVDAKTGVVTPVGLGTAVITMTVSKLIELECTITVRSLPEEMSSDKQSHLVLWDDFEEDKYTAGEDALWKYYQENREDSNFAIFKDGQGKDDVRDSDVRYNIVQDSTGNQYLELTGGTSWFMTNDPLYGNYTVQFDLLYTAAKTLNITPWQVDLRTGETNAVHSFINLTRNSLRVQYRPYNMNLNSSSTENPYMQAIESNRVVGSSIYQDTNGGLNIWQTVKIVRVEGGMFIKVWNRDTEAEPTEWTTILTHDVLDTDTADHFRMQFSAGAGTAALYVDNVRITQQGYTITYDVDGEKTEVFAPANKLIVAPEEVPEKEGFEFLGWYNGDKIWNFEIGQATKDMTLTAKWEEIPVHTIPVTDGKSTIHVDVTFKNGTVTVDPIDEKDLQKVMSDKTGSGKVTLDMSGLDEAVRKAVLPIEVFQQILKAAQDANIHTETLVIKLPEGTVELDEKAMQAICDTADGSKLTLVLDQIDEKKLSKQQKAAIEKLETFGILQVQLNNTMSGKVISDFLGGNATLRIPFAVPEGKKAEGFQIWYLAEDGSMTRQDTRYEDGYLVWSVGHFSEYVVMYEEPADEHPELPAVEDTGFEWLWILLAVGVVGAAAVVVIICKKKKLF